MSALVRLNAEDALRQHASNQASLGPETARDLVLLIQALRAASAEAKAAGQAKTAFLASISHELRAPLNSIIVSAELIGRDQGADCRHSDHARDILKDARRLLDILNDILDMARLEAGRMQVQRETIRLPDFLEEVRAELHHRLGPEASRLQVEISPGFPESLWTDRRRFRQILINLLSNALTYAPPDMAARLCAGVTASGDVQISIIDAGRGMTADELKRAITRFGHAESGGARGREGIGLGLPLAKALTELLGGRMTIESALGKGTTVVLSFPSESVLESAFQWKPPPDRTAERARRFRLEKS